MSESPSDRLSILLVNHGRAAELVGGDGVQIEATARGLRQRGHQVRRAVEAAMAAGRGDQRVRRLQARVRAEFHWQAMVDASERSYRLALERRRR